MQIIIVIVLTFEVQEHCGTQFENFWDWLRYYLLLYKLRSSYVNLNLN